MSARRSDTVALCLFGVLAGTALVRAMTMQARTPWWDLDPVFHPLTETGLLVSAQLAFDAVVWLCAGLCAVWACARGHRVRVWMGCMVCVGALGVLLHGRFLSPFVSDGGVSGDLRSLVVGSAWASALVGGWAVTHLVRAEAVRRIAPGVLFGLAFMLLARGALQVYVEHAYTLAAFESDPAAYLARSGIEPGSAMARVFERRLRHPDAVGWFGLSNVFAGVAAGCAVGMIGVVTGGWRGMGRWTRWAVLLGVAAGLACVAMSASKGGVAAVALGVLVVTVSLKHHKLLGRRWWGAIGVGCVFGVIAMVAVRGAIGERVGELSVLFRWHYLVGSARITAEHPVFGVGPAWFQDAYLLHKVPINPEEIERPHNPVADWVATLGVFGWVWVCVLFRLAWDAGCAVWAGVDADEDGATGGGDDASKWVLAAVGLSVAASIWVEQAALEAVGALARLGAGCAWVGVAVAVSRIKYSARWAGVGLGAAALALIAHGQIEVSMAHTGSAAWVFLVVGCAAGLGAGQDASRGASRARLWAGVVCGVVGLIGVGAVVWFGVLPAARWEGYLHGAASTIERGGFRENGDPIVLELAGEDLYAATSAVSGDTQANAECVRVMTLAYALRGAGVYGSYDAVEHAEWVADGWPGWSKSWAMVASAYAVRAVRSGAEEDWRAVAEAWERVGAVEPYGLESRWRAVEARVRAGDMEAARESAQELLRLDALYRLDPLKRLTEDQTGRLRELVGR